MFKDKFNWLLLIAFLLSLGDFITNRYIKPIPQWLYILIIIVSVILLILFWIHIIIQLKKGKNLIKSDTSSETNTKNIGDNDK